MFRHDMDCFIKECVHSFHNKQSRGYLSLSFLHLIFQQCVIIAFHHALTYAIKKKIALVGDTFLNLLLLLDLMICMKVTLEGLWVR